jgi:hypothetical protein
MDCFNSILLSDRGVLRLSGPDKLSFLQGLITQDSHQLSSHPALYTALLTPQGRYLFDMILVSAEEDILLDVAQGQEEALLSHLLKFKLRSQVTLENVSSLYEVRSLIDLPFPSLSGILFQDPRLPTLGYRWIREKSAPLPPQIKEIPFDSYELHRIKLGIPTSPYDLIKEKTIILEGGLDELKALSWTKGCYVGQELMARTRYKGVVRKRLFPVFLTQGQLNPGDLVMQGGEEVGQIGSSLKTLEGTWSLARLRLTAVQESLKSSPPLTCQGAPLQVHQPHWWSLPEPTSE